MQSSSNSSFDPAVDAVTICASPSVSTMLSTWLVLYVLLLPLLLYVLYLCSHQKNPSHSDFFTLHIIAMEIISMLGTVVYLIGGKRSEKSVQLIGSNIYSIGLIGQMFIHTLTCVERYLAVAHPITYLRLKERGGVTIRNTSIVAVWLLSVAITSLTHIVSDVKHCEDSLTMSIFISACSTISVVTFCCVSVLNILIRPGPGENGGDLRRIDQSKRRAFSTIMAIASVLFLRFIFLIVTYLLYLIHFLSLNDSCLLTLSAGFFTFPSSLVLPLLFLQRAGKLKKASEFCSCKYSCTLCSYSYIFYGPGRPSVFTQWASFMKLAYRQIRV